MMGACGFELRAPGVGVHSFTRSLIEGLRYYRSKYPISTAFLYGKIVTRAKISWNPRFERDTDLERKRTLVHIHLSNRSRQRYVELAPIQPFPQSNLPSALTKSPSQGASTTQSSATSTSPSADIDMLDPAESNLSQHSETSIESQNIIPRVLVTVALEQEQIMRSEDLIDWLKSIPALTRWIHVHSAYVRKSNLLLLSLPMII